jgi:two-component system response regulator AtoC
VSIHIPPLRDRPEDIPVLAEHFIEKYNRKLGLKITSVSPEAMKLLMRYNWRGNVRELENCVERAMVMADENVLDESSFPPAIREASAKKFDQAPVTEAGTDENLSIKERSKTLEIDLIRKALQKTKGNRTHAAKILEISHRALLYKLKEYQLGD